MRPRNIWRDLRRQMLDDARETLSDADEIELPPISPTEWELILQGLGLQPIAHNPTGKTYKKKSDEQLFSCQARLIFLP